MNFYDYLQNNMMKYKKELVSLREQAEAAAGALLRDDKVSNLQNQITWFKNEAVLLDEVIEKQTREIRKFEMREGRLVEDRKFLREQTKDAMKQNKVMKLALKKTEESNKAIKEFFERNKVKGVREEQSHEAPAQIIPTPFIT